MAKVAKVAKETRKSRTPVNVRLGDAGVKEVDEIAAADFSGNRSAAIKRFLTLGIAEYRRLKRLGKHA